MRIAITVSVVLIFFTFFSAAYAQDNAATSRDFRNVFEDVQHGFETCNIGAFSAHLGSQLQVALKGEESGYFSSNQAYYILEKFLKARKTSSFEFTNVGEAKTTPYATGTAVFTNKGTREVTQVYVALMRVAEKWFIAEINVY